MSQSRPGIRRSKSDSGGGLPGYALIAAAAMFWALSGIVAKFLFTSRAISPLLLVEMRLLVSFVVLAAFLGIHAPHELRIRRKDLPFFAVYGSAGMALVQLSYFTAVSEGNVATAIFLQYLAPAFTASYMVLWLRQPAPPGLAVNLSLALTGSALLLLGSGHGLATSTLGLVAGLTSALSMSFYTIYGAKGVGMYSPSTVLLTTLGVGSLVLMPLARPWSVLAMGWGAADWGFIAYMALLGTLVPFGLFLTGLRRVEPVQASLTAMLEPVLATFGAWFLLSESLAWPQVVGGALIVAAIARLQVSRSQNTRRLEAAKRKDLPLPEEADGHH